MDMNLCAGKSLGSYTLGYSLHSVLSFVKCDQRCNVHVCKPESRRNNRGVVVLISKADASTVTITFDSVYQLAVSVAIRFNENESAVLQEGESPSNCINIQQLDNEKILIGKATQKREEPIQVTLKTIRATVSAYQVTTLSGGRITQIDVHCAGFVLTFHHQNGSIDSEVKAPPPSMKSLQDVLNARCSLVEVCAVPIVGTPLYSLFIGTSPHSFGTGGRGLLPHLATVHAVVDSCTKRMVGIQAVSQHFSSTSVLFNDSIQAVVTKLGVPDSFFCARDKCEIFQAKARHQDVSQQSETQDSSSHRPDFFYNYFKLGLDVVFDAVTLSAKKFILHTNSTWSGEFGSYHRCHFRVGFFQNILAVGEKASLVLHPIIQWSQVAATFGTECAVIKKILHRDLEYHGHACTTSVWYRLLDQFYIEVLKHDHVSRIVIAECGHTAVPDLPQPEKQQASEGETVTSGLSNSIISVASNPESEEFEDANSLFTTPLASLEGGFPVQEPQLSKSVVTEPQQRLIANVNIVSQQSRMEPCKSVSETKFDELDIPFLAPCFSDPEESEEEDCNVKKSCEQTSHIVETDISLGSLWEETHLDSTSDESATMLANMDASTLDAGEERSVTSSYDILSSLKDVEPSPKVDLSSDSDVQYKPIDSSSESQSQTQAGQFVYKPGSQPIPTGDKERGGRLHEVIVTTNVKGKEPIKTTPVGGQKVLPDVTQSHRGKKGSKDKYKLTQWEQKRQNRLEKKTFSYSQHYKDEDNKSASDTTDVNIDTDSPSEVETSQIDVLLPTGEEDKGVSLSVVLEDLLAPEDPGDTLDDHADGTSMKRTSSITHSGQSSDSNCEGQSSTGALTSVDSLGSIQSSLLKQFDILSSEGKEPDHSSTSHKGSSLGEFESGMPNANVPQTSQSSANVPQTSQSPTSDSRLSDLLPDDDGESGDKQQHQHGEQEHARVVVDVSELERTSTERHQVANEEPLSVDDTAAHPQDPVNKWSSVNSPSAREPFGDTDTPHISLTSRTIEDISVDSAVMVAKLQSQLETLQVYLSQVFSSSWKQGFPAFPENIDKEEKDVLFTSALDVILENKSEYLTLQRCSHLLLCASKRLSSNSWCSHRSLGVLCEVVRNAALQNLESLECYKEGRIKVTSSEHHYCQDCYSRFERLSHILEDIPSVDEVDETIIETKMAVDKVLRKLEPATSKQLDEQIEIV